MKPQPDRHEVLLVRRWMSKTVHTAPPHGALMSAFEVMRDHRVRHVAIVDRERLVGIISDRDIRSALPSTIEHGRDCSMTNALLERKNSEVMATHPKTIGPHDSIKTAAEVMCREKISALPVVDDEELVGIITADDLLWAMVELL